MPSTRRRCITGQLADTEETLLKAIGGQVKTAIHTIVAHNDDDTNENQVVFRLQVLGGDPVTIASVPLGPGDAFHHLGPIYLNTGDVLLGSATNAAEVDYSINLEEEMGL